MPRKKKPTRLNSAMPHAAGMKRMVQDLSRQLKALSPEELADMDKRLEEAFPGGFNKRDEANALIAMAVRNGPIEDLHAGRSSAPFLEDASLSRITDDEMKTLMIHATRMLAGLLRVRDEDPDLYRRWIQTYGRAYCNSWEREL
jgi:hypothetical protein